MDNTKCSYLMSNLQKQKHLIEPHRSTSVILIYALVVIFIFKRLTRASTFHICHFSRKICLKSAYTGLSVCLMLFLVVIFICNPLIGPQRLISVIFCCNIYLYIAYTGLSVSYLLFLVVIFICNPLTLASAFHICYC